MSEEALEDAFELTEEDLLEGEGEEAEQEEQEEQEEEKPKASGYMSKEAWVASGKPEDEWVTEEVFKERTQRIKDTSRLKRELAAKEEEFENRLKNLNTLSLAQISRLQRQLDEARDNAIETGDKAEVKRIDKEKEELRKESELIAQDEKKQPPKPPEVVEWEDENPWINDVTDPRTPIAQKAYVEALNAGKSLAGCLRAADKAIAEYKPSVDRTEKRKPAPMGDTSRAGVTSRNDTVTLTWNQLKHDELVLYEELFEPSGMTKKDFLKTVADQRKGA